MADSKPFGWMLSAHPDWGSEALCLAQKASVVSKDKLDQQVRGLQRVIGHSREARWRFIIQPGLKGRLERSAKE